MLAMKKPILSLLSLFVTLYAIGSKAAASSDLVILNQTDLWMATQVHPNATCTSTPKEFCQSSVELAPNNVEYITSMAIVKGHSGKTIEFSIDANDEHIVTVDLKLINGRIQCSRVYSSKRYKGTCVQIDRKNDALCIVKKGNSCELPSN